MKFLITERKVKKIEEKGKNNKVFPKYAHIPHWTVRAHFWLFLVTLPMSSDIVMKCGYGYGVYIYYHL